MARNPYPSQKAPIPNDFEEFDPSSTAKTWTADPYPFAFEIITGSGSPALKTLAAGASRTCSDLDATKPEKRWIVCQCTEFGVTAGISKVRAYYNTLG